MTRLPSPRWRCGPSAAACTWSSASTWSSSTISSYGRDNRTENRVQEVSYISRNLKVLARELNVPVLAAAQLSRAVEQRTDKRPVLSDLRRRSGSIEQDADIVMFIYRPDQYEKDTVKQNVAEIIIAKHRNGPTGSVELVFMNHLAKFVDAATPQILI